MFAVFIDQVSPRIHYIFEELIGRRLQQEVVFFTNETEYTLSTAAYKIQYTGIQNDILPGFFVYRDDFMLSDNLDPYFDPSVGHFHLNQQAQQNLYEKLKTLGLPQEEEERVQRTYAETFPCFFLGSGKMGFDVFAMAFYFLSRYEEYQAFRGDHFGRFTYENAVVSSLDYNPAPYVDIAFYQLLSEIHATSLLAPMEVKATFDIDIAFRFKGRSWRRGLASWIRYPKHLIDRVRVWLGDPDPFDPEQTVFRFLENNPVNSRIFWLVSKHTRGVNRQVQRRYRLFQKRIQTSAREQQIGLHPSYSLAPEIRWEEEKRWLESKTGNPIVHSRQHFVHLLFPDTYRILQKLGIQHDWSMGFAETVGFRAGTSYDFLWFDLVDNNTTNLVVHPFCIMDVTAKNYLKLDPYAAIDVGRSLKELVFLFGGNFTFIAHNESLSKTEGWEHWYPVFESWARKEIHVGASLND